MEDVGAFMAIWPILLPFGIPMLWLFGIFSPYVAPKKSGNPANNSDHNINSYKQEYIEVLK
jgi:hypothetical protein